MPTLTARKFESFSIFLELYSALAIKGYRFFLLYACAHMCKYFFLYMKKKSQEARMNFFFIVFFFFFSLFSLRFQSFYFLLFFFFVYNFLIFFPVFLFSYNFLCYNFFSLVSLLCLFLGFSLIF